MESILLLDISISRTSIADSVAQQIRQMIVDRRLKPGDKLPSQRKFAIQLKVGRPTIREAFRSLASIGIIKVEHGRSPIVERVGLDTLISDVSPMIEITDTDVISLLETKDIIETRCAELAATRITLEEIEKMKLYLGEMEKYREDNKLYAAADYEFHYTLIRSARNPIINEIMKIVGRMIEKAIEKTVLGSGLAGREVAMQYHYRIYEAIRNGDAAMAARLVHEHLVETINRYSGLVEKQKNA
jgi:GntR family transcriptional repressor for pyruvate dehydrogenase complex